MDFLNQAIEQVRELFLSMTPAARLTAGLLVGVIGISLGFLFQQQSSGPDEYLFGGEVLSSHDANRIDLAIAQAGLNGYERVGNRFRVPRGIKSEYLSAVATAGAIPTNFDTLIEKALEDLGEFTSSATQRERLKAARERQLSMIVGGMDGIESAKVIYDITKPRGLSRDPKGTASVSVRPEPSEPLEARQIKMIQKTVAAAIAGLSMADVQVTDESNGSHFGGMGNEVSAEVFDTPYYQNRIYYEQWVEAKIANLISYIPNVRIQVTAELDNTSSHTTHSVTPEGDVAALHDSTHEEETSSTRKENGGRPGPIAQGPTRTGPESELATNENTSSNTEKETDNYIGTTEEFLEQAGLIPKQVRASISIPSNYLVSIWREKNPDQPEDAKPEMAALTALENSVKDKIKNVITPLLPRLEKGVDPYEQVELTVFESFTPAPIEEPSLARHTMAWLGQNANSMMMGVLALASLVMLRSVVKSISSSDPVPARASPALSIHQQDDDSTDQTSGSGTEGGQKSRPRLRLKKGANLKDDLAEIVNEDPEAAASILRGWIDNAA